MSNFVLSCCSTADLKKEHLESRNISYVCFHYYLDDQPYTDDLGQSMTYSEFYDKLRKGAVTRTSQVNVDEFLQYFTGFLENGKDILHVCLSSGISGVFNSASAAARELRTKYPERKIYVVDSLGASSGYGLIMDTLADLRDRGMDIEKLNEWVENNKLKMHHWFFSTDLTFYVSGGRISKTAGLFGTVLNICPLLNMNRTGNLIPRAKVRGKKNVIERIVCEMEECARDGKKYNGKCFISNSDCEEDAQAVSDLIVKRFPKLNGKPVINSVGTTIGSHTGPGTVALFFWGCEREE